MPEEKETIGSDVLIGGYPTARMSEKKKKELRKRLEEEIRKKEAEEEAKKKAELEKLPKESVPGETTHEKKIGETDTDKLVHVKEHYRSKPKKSEEIF